MYNLVKKICLTNGVMCDMSKFAEFHRDRDPMYSLVKKICLINAVKCDMSKFEEFHRDPDYASPFLFYLDWMFADFVA